MTYIENVFICLAIPLILSLFFLRGSNRRLTIFRILGMVMCLLSAYVNSFFMGYYHVDPVTTAVEISPMCEEALKLIPLLMYHWIFEPKPQKLPEAAVAIGVGFATFENVCYLAQNGAENFSHLLIRGISAGALHILCGILCGFGISYVFCHRWLFLTGTVGVFGFVSGFHAIYNLLTTTDGTWRMVGYLLPSFCILSLYVGGRFLPHSKWWQRYLQRT